jgi:type I restriction enzyme S subunit
MKKWEMVTLGDICEVVGGTTPSTSNEDYWDGDTMWLSPVDLPEVGTISEVTASRRKITPLAIKECGLRLLPINSIVFSTRASIGKIGIVKHPLTTNQGFTNLIPSAKVDPKFLCYALKLGIKDIEKLGNSTTFKEVSRTSIKNFKIPLPPLPTQKRIAEILDKADALRQKDQALLRKYDELAQAVFVDMFGDPVRNDKGWEAGSIRDIAREVKYGTSSPAENLGQFIYLRMNNITYDGDWDFANLKYISISEKEKNKYLLKRNDLVFNRTNSKELVGKTAVYDRDDEMIIAGYLIRVRLNGRGNPFYVSGFLNSPFGKSILQNMCKSIIGMANINAQELQDIQLPIPPISLQNEYEKRLKAIKNNKALTQKAAIQSESLFQSLLQKAFSGELIA